MRVYFHEMGLLDELRYRLQHPAALLIVLPNGLVKLINALPFVCGDLRRRQTLAEIWAHSSGVAGSARRASSSRISPPIRADGIAAPMGLSLGLSESARQIYDVRAGQLAARTSARSEHRLARRGLASLVRYRFFLYAGLLPYLLGAAWA